jgi:hypothetical protein
MSDCKALKFEKKLHNYINQPLKEEELDRVSIIFQEIDQNKSMALCSSRLLQAAQLMPKNSKLHSQRI